MKVSVCLTIKNEEKSISKLLDSLLSQTKKPDEIVIVDGGSKDKTVVLVKHYQKKDSRVRLLVENCSRAKGRNLAIELARNEIIAMTDAGCVPRKNWLNRITEPFEVDEIDIVAGFYTMTASDSLTRALSVYLGTQPDDFDVNYLPSTRSVAFRKEAWEKIGGFPENMGETAEDTVFNYKASKQGVKFARVKNARVEWAMPDSLSEGVNKIYNYAKGDVESGIWFHPVKGLASHNVRTIYKILRYLLGLVLIIYAFKSPPLWLIVFGIIIIYSLWAFRKVYKEFQDVETALWGIVLQYTTDFAAIVGFTKGLLEKFPGGM